MTLVNEFVLILLVQLYSLPIVFTWYSSNMELGPIWRFLYEIIRS